MSRIVVVSDTHARRAAELPEGILAAIREADILVHCGDYVGLTLLKELRQLSRRFLGVYGNADPGEVRRLLPAVATLPIEGHTIAVTHPYWGEHPDGLECELAARFPDADAILFGHSHETCNRTLDGTLLLNPGQGYASFMVPASYAVLTVTRDGIQGEVRICT